MGLTLNSIRNDGLHYLRLFQCDESRGNQRVEKLVNNLVEADVLPNFSEYNFIEAKSYYRAVDKKKLRLKPIKELLKCYSFEEFKERLINHLIGVVNSEISNWQKTYPNSVKYRRHSILCEWEDNLKKHLYQIEFIIAYENFIISNESKEDRSAKNESECEALVENVEIRKDKGNIKSILKNPDDYQLLIRMLTINGFLDSNCNFKYTRNEKGKIKRGASEIRNQIILIYWLNKNGFFIEGVDVSCFLKVFKNEFCFGGESSYFTAVYNGFDGDEVFGQRERVLKSYDRLKDSWSKIKILSVVE